MTVAVRQNGTVLVCESQSKGAYWPINGIQCNPYADWIRMATLAEFNYVWVPIDRSFELDADKAYAWVSQLLGVDYGFPVVLTGWIDTVQDNFPCMKDQVPTLISERPD